MLSYELCKKLKDAGFPDMEEVKLENPGDTAEVICNGDGSFIKSPALSELIEACEGFYELYSEEAGDWSAKARVDGKKYGKGETPEEAVANLWLSINSK